MAFERLRIWFQRQLAITPMERMLYPPLRLPVMFRVYEDRDFDDLLKIYELNAPGRFPEGSHEIFVNYLRSGQKGIFVGELNGKAICTGGLIQNGEDIYTLCYGLIHPEYQGQRIGSTMALLRLAATGRKESWEFVYTMIYAVPASIPFYQQFGFSDAGQWQCRDGKSYPSAMVVYQVNVAKRLTAELTQRGWKIHGGFEPHQQRTMVTVIRPNERGQKEVHFEWVNQSRAEGKSSDASGNTEEKSGR
jgi:GNAT superfamily N-acetyltransferase